MNDEFRSHLMNATRSRGRRVTSRSLAAISEWLSIASLGFLDEIDAREAVTFDIDADDGRSYCVTIEDVTR